MKAELEKTLEQLEKIYIDFDSAIGDLKIRQAEEKELQLIDWMTHRVDKAFCELLNEMRNYVENHA